MSHGNLKICITIIYKKIYLILIIYTNLYTIHIGKVYYTLKI